MGLSTRRIAVLGSTGSIGRQALEVIAAHPDYFEAVALVAGRDKDALRAQADQFPRARAVLGSDAAAAEAVASDVDVVLNGIVGAAGLRASLAALGAGKLLALANKESLVAGGEICAEAASRSAGQIVPVDSEHAALAQCLAGIEPELVARIVLTASGGPFRKRKDLTGVTPAEALEHPTWSMGPKITIDSATLMNKGLEIIEAHYLFGVPYDRIDVVVHPQSIVHGIVELDDGSSLLQAAPPDMRVPIRAALAWPERLPSSIPAVDLREARVLEFEDVDEDRFPAVGLARRAGVLGGTAPATLNAANEVAVAAFLDGRIRFTDIIDIVGATLDAHENAEASDLDSVLAADAAARSQAGELIDERVTSGVQR